jgi:hypothetical protein
MATHDDELRDAVRSFWLTRQHQSARQGSDVNRDRGARSAVTGGKQMDGFVRLVRNRLLALGVPESSIATHAGIELPG